MGQLPALTLSPAPLWQRRRLKAWLAEWTLREALAEPAARLGAAPSSLKLARAPMPVAPPARDPSPAVGQIRLLPPDLCDERPLYAALLGSDEPDVFWTIPFGPFAVPGLPGELALRRAAPTLRTMCVWNAVCVSARVLKRSWLADRLSESESRDAAALLAHVLDEAPVPARLARRVGPPYWHPADPRHAYRQEERRLTGTLRRQGRAAPLRYPTDTSVSARLAAAEPRSRYGRPARRRDEKK